MTSPPVRSARLRKLRAAWRDTRLLVGQFRWPLLAFCAAVTGGGTLYYVLSRQAGEETYNLAEAIYAVLSLTFLQPTGAFPHAWYLEAFYFIMPLIGVGILAQGVADFGVLFFNRRARGQEWEKAVAAMVQNHVILIGLGHLGYRVVDHLHQMGQEVVVIELNPAAHLVEAVRKLDIPVLQEDGTRESTLREAGVERARALILCTQNDSLNLQMAVKARSLNPEIRVIVRIFDDDFAQALHAQFGFTAYSAT
ncbi:MAG: NAD-binding protein, partial [Chloroflexi bacterium]|nr:NAD-binding protein [Chloroflexota bacterium]